MPLPGRATGAAVGAAHPGRHGYTQRYWYSLDGRGNVVALTDAGGQVVDRYHYDVWGVPTIDLERVPQPLLYAGYVYDREFHGPGEASGWYWLSVRHYDPALGRFLQPDPSEQEGLFSYAYAGDNPADRIDPTGLIATQPTTGCLLTGNNNVECNVQFNSAQWNNEVANGSTVITSLNGTPLSELVPLLCGTSSRVCLISSRNPRHVGAADCGFLSFACDLVGSFVSGARHILVYAIDGARILCDATLCGDLTTIRNGPWYMKILAAGDIILTFVPVGGEVLKGGEIAARLTVGIGEHLSAPEAEKVAARIGEEVAAACRTRCFPAGTLVATPEGGKPIERVRAGDQVLTEDPKTGKVEAEAVAAVRHDAPTWVMAIGLADGSTIEVTPEHPFWVDRGSNFAGPGWLKAGELRIGDQLRTAGGAEATVVALRYHVERVEVYTLTLGANHDFFVGTARVLVHNCNPADALYNALKGTPTGESIDRAAPNWYQSTFNAPEYSLSYHWDKHAAEFGSNLTPEEYTQKALDFYSQAKMARGTARQVVELPGQVDGITLTFQGKIGIFRQLPDGGIQIVDYYRL